MSSSKKLGVDSIIYFKKDVWVTQSCLGKEYKAKEIKASKKLFLVTQYEIPSDLNSAIKVTVHALRKNRQSMSTKALSFETGAWGKLA